MRRLALLAAAGAVGAGLALAALGVLHHQLLPAQALVVGALAAGSLAVVRAPWAHLPPWIGAWLDLGVVVAAALLASAGHGLTFGLAFVVLRGPELGLLTGAALGVAVATTGLAYTHLRLAAEVEAQARRLAELERAALRSRLSVLSAQINPHFLFNTLNTLAELVHEDEDAAEDMVTDLAAMMRTALRSSTALVPLREELDLVRRLLRIEAARFGDRLDWAIEGEDAPVQVPGLLIQPLVENAVKHAVAPRPEGGAVRVSVSIVDDRVLVRITDDGPGLPPEVAAELAAGSLSMRGTEGHGGGLRSCVERLRLTWGGAARLRHDPAVPGTCLILDLPRGEPT
ncbi:MAG: histidine kinase [Alphaproteobacteria bacterium]|nr:histidine kinase [Alphaproteobacteria bacterium]